MATRRITERVKALDAHLKLLVSIGTSVVAVVGALIAGFVYVTTQVNAVIDERVDKMEAGLKSQLDEQKLSLTRLELMTLIQSDPTNKVEIERLARDYFINLNGNSYVSSVYTKWCEEYGGDIAIAVK